MSAQAIDTKRTSVPVPPPRSFDGTMCVALQTTRLGSDPESNRSRNVG